MNRAKNNNNNNNKGRKEIRGNKKTGESADKYLHQNYGTFLYKEPVYPSKNSIQKLGVGVGVGSFLAEDFRQLLYVLDGVFESLDLGQRLSSAAVNRRQIISQLMQSFS